jgi:gamma-glutamyltranspeptidase/glutathione hydrolase
MRGAVAGGHPLTAEAGARVLAAGGNAVDACVGAAFASWVTESPLTGPGAGGFILVHRARDRSTRLLDFFVATPGLGLRHAGAGEMHAVDVGFGDSETKQVFRIGPASCAVPGTIAGLEAAHRAYGSLPWRELVAPAVELARGGIELTKPQAHLHAILDLILRHTPEGERVYGKNGARFVTGDVVRLADLADTLEAIAHDGARAFYRGDLGRAAVATVREGGGRMTREDLAAYRPVWRRPVRVSFRSHEFVSNPPPSSGGILIAYGLALLERLGGTGGAGSAEAIAALVEVMREQTRAREDGFSRGLHRGGLARRLLDPDALRAALERIESRRAGAVEAAPAGGTTHISAIDADGNAASLSSSTGSGSGVIVPGTGIHLNNMLGEYDLVTGAPAPAGRRLTSMMAPSIVLDEHERPRLVVGSAGSVRLRGAIMQIVVNVLEHGHGVDAAIAAPRVHVDEPHVHCEGGFAAGELDRLSEWGYDVVRWRRRNLFFGGSSAVEVEPGGRLAAAGDPRRGGAGVVVAR